MSRYTLLQRADVPGQLDIVIGFDPPLSTFHLTVQDHAQDDDGEIRTLVFLGGQFKGLIDVDHIIGEAAKYAEIPKDLAAKLRKDLAEQSRPRPNRPTILDCL